eukprot:4246507-Pleurochrysis_carterae.AAC.1
MPGAFLKGNTLFPGSRFSVDDVTRPWDVHGTSQADTESNADFFTNDTRVSVSYYKLKHIIVLSVHGTITPSTLPYYGTEGSTAYLYQSATNALPGRMRTQMHVDIDQYLSAAPFHFENALTVCDMKNAVFYNTSEDERPGTVHINGRLHPTRLVLTVPTGLFPHHTYTVAGTLAYEPL